MHWETELIFKVLRNNSTLEEPTEAASVTKKISAGPASSPPHKLKRRGGSAILAHGAHSRLACASSAAWQAQAAARSRQIPPVQHVPTATAGAENSAFRLPRQHHAAHRTIPWSTTPGADLCDPDIQPARGVGAPLMRTVPPPPLLRLVCGLASASGSDRTSTARPHRHTMQPQEVRLPRQHHAAHRTTHPAHPDTSTTPGPISAIRAARGGRVTHAHGAHLRLACVSSAAWQAGAVLRQVAPVQHVPSVTAGAKDSAFRLPRQHHPAHRTMHLPAETRSWRDPHSPLGRRPRGRSLRSGHLARTRGGCATHAHGAHLRLRLICASSAAWQAQVGEIAPVQHVPTDTQRSSKKSAFPDSTIPLTARYPGTHYPPRRVRSRPSPPGHIRVDDPGGPISAMWAQVLSARAEWAAEALALQIPPAPKSDTITIARPAPPRWYAHSRASRRPSPLTRRHRWIWRFWAAGGRARTLVCGVASTALLPRAPWAAPRHGTHRAPHPLSGPASPSPPGHIRPRRSRAHVLSTRAERRLGLVCTKVGHRAPAGVYGHAPPPSHAVDGYVTDDQRPPAPDAPSSRDWARPAYDSEPGRHCNPEPAAPHETHVGDQKAARLHPPEGSSAPPRRVTRIPQASDAHDARGDLPMAPA
ncbi:hypothetical protein DFH07DRAFT_1056552 [Mycena maculata]|uniref:Uncharacterized protein n=1 Tax=Mycena maculata TaxID=230809 RepID=A0AAD7K2I0_9AGAR|nr:hypothetical protein DFH07DRAFT_1056552 [Mycena maculata]